MLKKIIVIDKEISEVKALFEDFIVQYEQEKQAITSSIKLSLNYTPNIALESSVYILKKLYEKQVVKLFENKLSKKNSYLKLDELQIELIQLFLSPVIRHKFTYVSSCEVFLDQINSHSKWQIYQDLVSQKEVKLLEYKQKTLQIAKPE